MKEYEFQISEHNIRHTKVIAIQNAIFIAKVLIETAKKMNLLLICLIQKLCGYVEQQMCC